MKNIIKKHIVFGFFFLFLSSGSATERINVDDLPDCTNYVLIQGSSTINKFEFINYHPSIFNDENTQNVSGSYKNIQIPVREFSGSNNMMLKDLHEMLNVSEYPVITIEIEPTKTADFDETTGFTNFETKITISGNTRKYSIPCQFVDCDESGKVVKGNIELELSDFEINPPTKLFGTVKVNDDVFITFAFNYQ